MAVSILHRVTGGGADRGRPRGADLVAARAWPAGAKPMTASPSSPATALGLIVLIGLTWAFFQHLLSGIRHLVMDTGADLRASRATRTSRSLTIVGSVLLTALTGWSHLGSMRNEPGRQRIAAGQGPRPRLGARWRRALADRAGHQHRAAAARRLADRLAAVASWRSTHATVSEWLRAPSGAVPMALFVITAFRHGLDGLKVVVDDYVHDDGNRFALNTCAAVRSRSAARRSPCSRWPRSPSEPPRERLQDHRPYL